MRRRLVLFFLLWTWSFAVHAGLNVSIVVFDAGVPDDRSLHRDLAVFPKIRQVESLFLPFVLRDALVTTGDWGAVRVIPQIDPAAELSLTGTIAHSDGGSLELHIRAVDASGREWIDQRYASVDGYELLCQDIARDLLHARRILDDKALETIVNVSLMRYASALAPNAFEGYVEAQDDGRYRLIRLPAESDPMMARIHRVRGVEYVMTDAIDEKFRELHAEIESVYDVWREYRRWYHDFVAREAERHEMRASNYPRGSYETMRRAYDDYRMDRLAAQEQEKWIVGFDNEVGPTIERIEARVAELTSWVEDGYLEWSRILEQLFDVETRQPPPGLAPNQPDSG